MNACTRPDGRTVGLLVAIVFVATVRLSAQSIFQQFSYENLRPSALQLDIGTLGGTNITGAMVGGLRLDYGRVAPKVRVLLGLSYFQSQISAEAQSRFEQRLRSVVIDPSGDDTINLGRVTWSDLTGDLDLQYVLPVGRAVTSYLGLGFGVHLRNGNGSAIKGTFVEDALDEIAAGLNATFGTEIGAKRWRVTVDVRGVLSSGLSTASVRTGVMYHWASSAPAGGGARR